MRPIGVLLVFLAWMAILAPNMVGAEDEAAPAAQSLLSCPAGYCPAPAMKMCPPAKFKAAELVELRGGARLFVVGKPARTGNVWKYNLAISKKCTKPAVTGVPEPTIVRKIE